MKPFSIIIGLKSVFRRKQKNFFGILAIALGVSLITGISVTNQSLSSGFGIFFTYSLGNVDGSITYDNGFFNQSIADSIGSNLLTLSNVTAFTDELSIPVTTSTEGGLISTNSVLKGIHENDNTGNFGKLLDTNNKQLNVSNLGPNDVFIGNRLAYTLRISVNDPFNFSLSFQNYTIERTFIVQGIVKNTQRGAMASNYGIFMGLKNLQVIMDPTLQKLGFPVTAPVSVIYLKFSSSINNVDKGNELIAQMKHIIVTNVPQIAYLGGINQFTISDDRITIKNFGTTLANALGDLLSIFGSILIIAGLILIVNIQLMTIENREKQIGIQRAVGTQNYQIILSNLVEFVITGLFGGLLGILGGVIFGWILVLAFGQAFGFDGSLIPISIPASIYVSAFVIGFVISILAGLYPSIKASRINIIEVLRGMDIKDSSIKKGSGIWGFVFGLLLTVLGLFLITSLSQNPLNFPNAYHNVNDAESIYISTTFLLIGLLVLLSYFVSRNTVLTIAGLVLIAYPVFQIFVIFHEIKAGSGGVNYLIVMTLSLVGGSILLVSLNLDIIAKICDKFFSIFFSAVSLISFKQMSSQKTRSTLTFAIFAIILSLNIFLASWSYSDRFGAEREVNILAGNADIVILSSQPVSTSLASQYITGLKKNFSAITNVVPFSSSGFTNLYLNPNGTINTAKNATNTFPVDIFAINNKTFLQDGQPIFNFLLDPAKLNTTDYSFPGNYSTGLEIDNKTLPLDHYANSNIQENINTWEFLSSGLEVTNKTSGEKVPVIITSQIAKLDVGASAPVFLKNVMDSVWLPLANGSFQEFVIIAISPNNPLFDSTILTNSFGNFLNSGAFVSSEWASKLAAFNPSGNFSYLNQYNSFLVKTSYPVKSNGNNQLSGDIEAYSNGNTNGTFRTQEHKLFGFISSPVYSIYETAFQGQFQVFTFMQYFTTLGLLFGIVSLLVVSVRSVQERKREIGMMRSIGVKRRDVIVSLILELSVMGVIGLVIGILIGNLLAYGLVTINSSGFVTFLIPWGDIFIYSALTLISALVASIVPGRVASTIPPSDALRYTG